MQYDSPTEIVSHGNVLGSIPWDIILKKYEITDSNLTNKYKTQTNTGDMVKDFQLRELMNKRSETPFTEGDKLMRNGIASKNIINLKYMGNRGGVADGPKHPEMFMNLGFIGPDPRGPSGDPRFDKLRTHMEIRAHALEVQMGDNAVTGETQRPIKGATFEFMKEKLFKLWKGKLKVFDTTFIGRPSGNNIATTANLDKQRAKTYGLIKDDYTRNYIKENKNFYIPEQHQRINTGMGKRNIVLDNEMKNRIYLLATTTEGDKKWINKILPSSDFKRKLQEKKEHLFNKEYKENYSNNRTARGNMDTRNSEVLYGKSNKNTANNRTAKGNMNITNHDESYGASNKNTANNRTAKGNVGVKQFNKDEVYGASNKNTANNRTGKGNVGVKQFNRDEVYGAASKNTANNRTAKGNVEVKQFNRDEVYGASNKNTANNRTAKGSMGVKQFNRDESYGQSKKNRANNRTKQGRINMVRLSTDNNFSKARKGLKNNNIQFNKNNIALKIRGKLAKLESKGKSRIVTFGKSASISKHQGLKTKLLQRTTQKHGTSKKTKMRKNKGPSYKGQTSNRDKTNVHKGGFHKNTVFQTTARRGPTNPSKISRHTEVSGLGKGW